MLREGSEDLQVERRKAVEVAQAVLENRLGICEACRMLAGLAHGVVEDWRVDPDFVVIGAFASENDRFPLGQVSKWWAPTILEGLDQEREKAERGAAPAVMAACRSIVARLSAAEQIVGPDGRSPLVPARRSTP